MKGGGGVDQTIVSSPHHRFGITQPSVAWVALSQRGQGGGSVNLIIHLYPLPNLRMRRRTQTPSPTPQLCVWRDALIDIRCDIDNKKEGFLFGLFYIALPCVTIILE